MNSSELRHQTTMAQTPHNRSTVLDFFSLYLRNSHVIEGSIHVPPDRIRRGPKDQLLPPPPPQIEKANPDGQHDLERAAVGDNRVGRGNHCRAGVAVAERLDCSPPTKANRVQSPAGPLPDFFQVGILPEDLMLDPPLHSDAAPFSPHFTAIGSQDLGNTLGWQHWRVPVVLQIMPRRLEVQLCACKGEKREGGSGRLPVGESGPARKEAAGIACHLATRSTPQFRHHYNTLHEGLSSSDPSLNAPQPMVPTHARYYVRPKLLRTPSWKSGASTSNNSFPVLFTDELSRETRRNSFPPRRCDRVGLASAVTPRERSVSVRCPMHAGCRPPARHVTVVCCSERLPERATPAHRLTLVTACYDKFVQRGEGEGGQRSMAATSSIYSRYFVVTLDCISSFPRYVTHMPHGASFKRLTRITNGTYVTESGGESCVSNLATVGSRGGFGCESRITTPSWLLVRQQEFKKWRRLTRLIVKCTVIDELHEYSQTSATPYRTRSDWQGLFKVWRVVSGDPEVSVVTERAQPAGDPLMSRHFVNLCPEIRVGWTPRGNPPRSRSRSEGAIRAALTRTSSASSLLRARRAVFPSTRNACRLVATRDIPPRTLRLRRVNVALSARRLHFGVACVTTSPCGDVTNVGRSRLAQIAETRWWSGGRGFISACHSPLRHSARLGHPGVSVSESRGAGGRSD
ncbi:hypothetical protein PR048_024442 [Dryococelus australis]|uniref:Uncharacterized protein n=1 Tax=Dryococelus australis TaxID=614101 RepID=A0ABQ9GNN7_9NEOP|nr:hypothetical protein PR048_024442 [Dryococelus australis]